MQRVEVPTDEVPELSTVELSVDEDICSMNVRPMIQHFEFSFSYDGSPRSFRTLKFMLGLQEWGDGRGRS